MAHRTSFSPQILAEVLTERGIPAVREASLVSGSPYDYVYVFLTEAGFEGPHLVLSDALELEQDIGVFVGRHDPEKDDADVGRVDTLAEAIEWAVDEVAAWS